MKNNALIHGFRLLNERRLEEIDSTGRILVHEKSGARLVQIANADEHRVFCIGFRTPPADNTGLPHILEHSVLCGSRRYPVKEPFVELAKGSLKTFLNAMTYPDKTIYPIASKNAKDFRNLMSVYLDAVFYPRIYDSPEILMQEGWHYELDKPDGEISYKGVVYNEMKGALSVPESVLFRKVQESLFPGHVYGRESGGDPEAIPDLTQEQFLVFHRTYYHPANSFIYVYGGDHLDEDLEFLDSEYLAAFRGARVDSAIPLQAAFACPSELEGEYAVSAQESVEDKCYLSLNFATGSTKDPEVYLALDILEHLLLETQAAPLKRSLLDAGLGKDVFGSFENGILQPIFSIVVKNSNQREKDRFGSTAFDALRGLAARGIDKKIVEASLNAKEFALREADYRGYPKGLVYCVRVLDSWLYDADPFLHVQFNGTLDRVKQALKTDYFERMIDRYFLSNSHRSLVVVKPRPGLAEQAAEQTRTKLRALKEKMEPGQIDALVKSTQELKARQTVPDSEKALSSIPQLRLAEVSRSIEEFPLENDSVAGFELLRHPQFANGILYLSLYFDTRAVPQNRLAFIPLLASLLGRLSTRTYNDAQLSNEINIHTGGIHFGHTVFEENADEPRYFPKFLVRSKAFPHKAAELLDLLAEILVRTKLDEAPRIREILQETRSRLEMALLSDGHSFARKRLLSYFSQAGCYGEQVSGVSFYHFIRDLETRFKQKLPEIVTGLQETARAIFNPGNLIASMTGAQSDLAQAQRRLESAVGQLGRSGAQPCDYRFDPKPRNEALMTPGKVQYVAKGFNFHRLGYSYRHTLNVLQTILGLDYLWNRVRVQGGAYGAFAGFARGGSTVFASYRDPNLRETLDIYDQAGAYLRQFEPPLREMTKYVIGTVGKIDFPLTPSLKGEQAAENYIRGVTQRDLQAQKNEVLSTTSCQMREFGDMIADVMKQNCYCVMGSEGRLKEDKDLFGALVPVFE